MEHSFDIILAEKYGILEAVIIKHFQFWLAKNKANGTHCHDGKYWTYNSIDAFQKLFPYVSCKTIRNAIGKLVKEGVLITGNYNQDPHNHTKWYTFSERFACEVNSICPKGQIDVPERADVYTDIDITDNIDNSSLRSELSESLLSTTITEKNNNSSTTPYSPPSKAKPKFDLSFIADEFREDYTAWLDYRREIHKPFKTQRSMELNYQAALRLSGNDPKVFKQIIEQSIANGWQGLFELKNTNNNATTSSNGSRSAATGERPEQKERNYNFYSF